MAWDTTLVTQLRYIINDHDSSNYSWTNDQLKIFICIATMQVDTALGKWQSITLGPYTVDIASPTISPDPTLNSAPQGFTNLITFNAALIIATSELKKMGFKAGYKIVDDKSTIDTTGVADALRGVIESMKEIYKDALLEFQRGHAYDGSAILSPYASSENPLANVFNNLYYGSGR